MWVGVVTLGAVSFSVVPARVAAGFFVVMLIAAFLITLIPVRAGKLGRHAQPTRVVIHTDPGR